MCFIFFFFFKQKTAYEMRISDWSSDVCSSDLINLEDIAAPNCFIIEAALKERMNIPVFHDDQHGTAIITAAGLINACHLTGRDLKDIRVVVNGAGAAAIACTELITAMGVPPDHVIRCDRTGTNDRASVVAGKR